MVERAVRSLLRAGDRIVCLGDSITADPEGYVTMAGQVLGLSRPDDGIEVINAGVCGNTAADLLARFKRDVLADEPTWVTISAGVNDAARSVPPEEYAQAVTSMVDLAQAERLQVALCTPTRFEDPDASGWAEELNRSLATYNTWLERTAARRGCLLVPMFRMFRRVMEAPDVVGELWLTSDGCHMSPVGRYLMGLTFLAAFRVSLTADPGEVAIGP